VKHESLSVEGLNIAHRVLVLHKSPDEVAQMNGCHFHSDGVHLNSRGGMIVADLVEQFIDR